MPSASWENSPPSMKTKSLTTIAAHLLVLGAGHRQAELKSTTYIRGMLAEGSWQVTGYPRPHLGVPVGKKQRCN